MNKLEWRGLYNESWQGDLVPDAYAHPAKYSRGLIRHIYRYMLDGGMIAAGDMIGDPFGGVAAGALDAMLNGLHWRGVELEPRFVSLAQQNIALWNDRYALHMPRWGTAAIVQGDSRNFAELVGGLGAVASSPPYINAVNGMGGPIDYSKTKRDGDVTHQRHGMTDHDFAYGSTPGQLGSMPPGLLDAVASSPPFERQNAGGGIGAAMRGEHNNYTLSPEVAKRMTSGHKSLPGYMNQGMTVGQLGQVAGDTFWAASRVIVEQVHLALKPGGYAAFVCGDFVRKGRRVHFGRQWLALCEACGLEAVAWAIAWKTEHHGTQTGLFGDVERRRDRVSFFRRLANERNPDAAILNEDVILVRKQLSPFSESVPQDTGEA